MDSWQSTFAEREEVYNILVRLHKVVGFEGFSEAYTSKIITSTAQHHKIDLGEYLEGNSKTSYLLYISPADLGEAMESTAKSLSSKWREKFLSNLRNFYNLPKRIFQETKPGEEYFIVYIVPGYFQTNLTKIPIKKLTDGIIRYPLNPNGRNVFGIFSTKEGEKKKIELRAIINSDIPYHWAYAEGKISQGRKSRLWVRNMCSRPGDVVKRILALG